MQDFENIDMNAKIHDEENIRFLNKDSIHINDVSFVLGFQYGTESHCERVWGEGDTSRVH